MFLRLSERFQQALSEGLACPLKPFCRRVGRDRQNRGHLAHAPASVVAQQQDLPLVRRQPAQLLPHQFGDLPPLQIHGWRGVGRRSFRLHLGASLRLPQQPVTRAPRNGRQPRAYPFRLAQGVQGLERLDKGLLHRVFCFAAIAHMGPRHRANHVVVAFNQDIKRFAASAQRLPDQSSVGYQAHSHDVLPSSTV